MLALYSKEESSFAFLFYCFSINCSLKPSHSLAATTSLPPFYQTPKQSQCRRQSICQPKQGEM